MANTGVTVSNIKSSPGITASINPTVIRNGSEFHVSAHVDGGATGYIDILNNGQEVIRLGLSASGDISGSEHVPTGGDGAGTITFAYSGDANYNPVSANVNYTVSASGAPADPTAPTNPGPTTGSILYAYSITQADGTTSGYDLTGNMVAFSDTVNGQWSAGYDQLNRITSATQSKVGSSPQFLPPSGGTQQNFCWQYDSFGNRTLQASSDQPFGTNCQAQTNAAYSLIAANYNANNQIVSASGAPNGYVLDASGNVQDDGFNQYLYDGDGRMCAQLAKVTGAITGYLYNAEGQRVAKGSLSSFSCDPASNGFQMSNEYILGAGGEQLTELDGKGAWIHTNAYAGGQLVATYDNKGIHFHLPDWLGTRRVQTDYLGTPELACSGGSFGDQLNCTGSASNATEHHFTGKERDAESGLDYFEARYYEPSVGRWLSPDWSTAPSSLPYADLHDPQSLNLYSYVRNNPLSRFDNDGHLENRWGWNDPIWGGGAEGPDETKEMQSSLQRHDSIIYHNYDPEGIAHDSIGYEFTGGDGSRLDRDKQYSALAVGLGSAKEGESPETIRDGIQYIYDHLALYANGDEYNEHGHPGLHGGNWNFSVEIGALNILNMGFKTTGSGRNGVVPSVHIEGDHFHVDTANGGSIAGPIHWIWDVGLGSYYPDFNRNGIPR